MKRKILNKFLFLLISLYLTGCSSTPNLETNEFTFDELIKKYNLYESKTFGSLDKEGYEIFFNDDCFLFNDKKENSFSKNNENYIYLEELGTFKYIENGVIKNGSFFGSDEMSATSLDELIEEITNPHDPYLLNGPVTMNFIGNREKVFSKRNLISLDKNNNNFGRIISNCFGNIVKTYEDTKDYALGDIYKISLNQNNKKLRYKHFKNEVFFSKENLNLRDVLPYGNDDGEDPEEQFNFYLDCGLTHNNSCYIEGSHYMYPGCVEFKYWSDFLTYGYNEVTFLNPYSNNEPYVSQNSEPFNCFKLFNFIEQPIEEEAAPFIVDMTSTIEIMEASGSVIGNNPVTSFIYNTSYSL